MTSGREGEAMRIFDGIAPIQWGRDALVGYAAVGLSRHG